MAKSKKEKPKKEKEKPLHEYTLYANSQYMAEGKIGEISPQM